MFSINHIVYTNNSGIVSCYYQGIIESSRNQSLQMLAKGLHCKPVFLRITDSDVLLTLSAQYLAAMDSYL